jgi:hypothetical protein
MEHGIELAGAAAFEPTGRLHRGKPWRVICDVADALHAEPIVVGARGLGRIESALLGSVSSAVIHHGKRPGLVIPRGDADSPLPNRSRMISSRSSALDASLDSGALRIVAGS